MKYAAMFRHCLLLVLAATLLGCPSSFLYYPEKTIRATPALYGLPFEPLSFETKDKVMLSGWWVPARDSLGVILFCHGNGGNVSYFMESLPVWNGLSLSVLTFDYRGYGRSEGRPSEEGTYRDAEAAWNYLVQVRRIPPARIIVLGRSLGGPIAARLAAKRNPGLLIIESSFTSIPALVHDLYPWVPARLLLGDAYPTERYIGAVKCPVLIVHSPDDEIVPFSHGKRLYEAAPEPKQFLTVSGSHNDGFSRSVPVYRAGLEVFVASFLEADN